MRNLFLLILVFGFFTASSQRSYNTGNSQLDADLNVINIRARADFGSFKADMIMSYNVTEKNFNYMSGRLHLTPGEIYLALEISKIAKVHLDEVLSIYKTNKAKGWGVIARQAGIKPGSAEFHQLKNDANSKKGKGPGNMHLQTRGNKKKK